MPYLHALITILNTIGIIYHLWKDPKVVTLTQTVERIVEVPTPLVPTNLTTCPNCKVETSILHAYGDGTISCTDCRS